VAQGGVTTSYGYDGGGERVRAVSGGVTTIYLEGLWEETLGTGATVKTHYSFGGQLVAVRNSAPASLSYLRGDHLGSVRLATGTSGAVLNSQAFGPWGEEQAGSGVPQTSTDFTGQQRDPTGLLYYHARFYDPVLARFISADTIVPGAGALTTWPSDATAAGAWAMGGGG
jgi:RHS repeat-associated protein